MTSTVYEPGMLFDNHYRLIKPLSTDGGTADVWIAEDVSASDCAQGDDSSGEENRLIVAIKIYRPKNLLDVEGEKCFREEFKNVYNCRHVNILHPTAFSVCQGIPYLVMPYCRLGSSEEMIGKETDFSQIWRYVRDVASGLDYLHSCIPPIIHQDIKPANVLIDDQGRYAITDFGISSRSGETHGLVDEKMGTTAYMAPERFSREYVPACESDIWALGASLYEIICKSVPFGESGGETLLVNPMARPSFSRSIPYDIKRLICRCLDVNMSRRPTAAELVKIADNHLNGRRMRRVLLAVAALALAAVVTMAVVISWPRQEIQDNDSAFTDALVLLDSEFKEDAEKGLEMMDRLAAEGFVPAMYEVAFTYGWYSDSKSLKRKDVLGIEYYTSGKEIYLPIQYQDNNKATAYLNTIIERKDTSHAGITAHAMYRLACYYNETDKVYSENEQRAIELLFESRKWAEMAGDNKLMTKIDDVMAAYYE